MERLGAAPGVTSVARGRPPLAGGLRSTSVVVNGNKLMSNGKPVTMWYSFVSDNYFQTLSIPIVDGRSFTNQETRDHAPIVIVSEATARRLWPGQDPIGKQVLLDARDQFHDEIFPAARLSQVVGVTKDVHMVRLREVDENYIFLPLGPDQWYENMLVRTDADPNAVMATLGRQIQTVDPNVSVFAESLDGLLTNNPEFVFSRIGAIFSAAIGLLGLLLGAVGIYGSVSYAVVQRTHEMGIRMALGADKRDVLKLILHQSMRPIVLGMVLGLAGAAAASQILKALLFGLSALDATAFLGVSVLLSSVAMLASYLPARRATRVDPIVALRYE
jgi:putative ABC transport system permease protein